MSGNGVHHTCAVTMIAGPSPWYSASSATCGSIPALLICSYSEATCWNLQTCDVVQPGTSHGLHVPHLCQGFRIQVRWRRHAGEGELRQSRWWTNSRWELKSPKAAHSRRRRRQSGAGAAWEARCLRRSRHSCDETFCDDPTNKTQNHAAPLACLEGVGDLAGAADLLAALESRGLSDPQGLLGLGVPGKGRPGPPGGPPGGKPGKPGKFGGAPGGPPGGTPPGGGASGQRRRWHSSRWQWKTERCWIQSSSQTTCRKPLSDTCTKPESARHCSGSCRHAGDCIISSSPSFLGTVKGHTKKSHRFILERLPCSADNDELVRGRYGGGIASAGSPLRAFGPWCARANGRWSGIKTSACFLADMLNVHSMNVRETGRLHSRLHQAFTTAADPGPQYLVCVSSGWI